MALDITGLLNRIFSVPPGGFILRDVLSQNLRPGVRTQSRWRE